MNPPAKESAGSNTESGARMNIFYRMVQIISAVVALTAGLPPAAAQPRDGAMTDSRDEAAAEQCRSDPECMALVSRSEKRDAEAQREYEAKPWIEKVAPWALLIAAGAAIVLWPRKKRRKR